MTPQRTKRNENVFFVNTPRSPLEHHYCWRVHKLRHLSFL